MSRSSPARPVTLSIFCDQTDSCGSSLRSFLLRLTASFVWFAVRISSGLEMSTSTRSLRSGLGRKGWLRCGACLLTGLLISGLAEAQATRPRRSVVLPDLPAGQQPIDYFGVETRDRVARLGAALTSGEMSLANDPEFGRLPALLDALEVPRASQILLPSSGSIHAREISPQRPRAIYANDEVTVAWFPGASQIELTAQDPRKGTLFYVAIPDGAGLRFMRQSVCLACHANSQSGIEVIGHNVATGIPLLANSTAAYRTHQLPFDRRWKQLYASQPLTAGFSGVAWPPATNPNQPLGRTLAETSDPVALVVRDHWNYGLNLLNRWSQEHQLGQPAVGERILPRYLLMVNEADWPAPLSRESAYVAWFEHQGPRTSDGRSLRQLNLQTRTFDWQVSPLLFSRMVQEQPAAMRVALYQRLEAYLSGAETFPNVTLDRERCEATRSILRELLPDWPRPAENPLE